MYATCTCTKLSNSIISTINSIQCTFTCTCTYTLIIIIIIIIIIMMMNNNTVINVSLTWLSCHCSFHNFS